jgi:hypothetical protein
MTLPDWLHEMEDGLYGAVDALIASFREGRERETWNPELVAYGARTPELARRVSWRASERVLSLQRLLGG